MDWFVLFLFLLSGFLLPCIGQIAAPTTTPTGCAGPPALCCSGQNSTCRRVCFCDEACRSFNDCCSDFISTCVQPQSTTSAPSTVSTTSSSTVSDSTASSTTNSSTTSAPSTVSTTSSSTVSDSTASSTMNSSTTSAPSSTASASTATSTPSDGLTTSATAETTTSETTTTLDTTHVSTKTDSETTTSSDEDTQTVTVHLKASLFSYNEDNEDAIVEALSSFLSKAVLQGNCEGCTLSIRNIKPT
ncbi:bypass of stop codon protein 1-like [Stegastes partitus]|uniref:Bypass of stop codon protein 1-like n=1 Tax=Stegastes partitus TaxID=144197 RepID=A0A9Y4MXN8_9TELE|nr:PREDICTED: bypass of stop codon protein 1-like [Stegastes partitus]